MSWSKSLYRRLPYFIRRHLSRSQSFGLIVTIVVLASLFLFYETLFGLSKTADDLYQERSAAAVVLLMREKVNSCSCSK